MSETNWKRIAEAPRNIGPVLLRIGSAPLDGVFVGAQTDDGTWVDQEGHTVQARYWALIPDFDCEDGAAA